PVKLPKATSRESVQVVLRDNISTSPVLSGSNRSFADSGVNFTLVPSLSTAAAIARPTSTARPVQLPLASGLGDPRRPRPPPPPADGRAAILDRLERLRGRRRDRKAEHERRTKQQQGFAFHGTAFHGVSCRDGNPRRSDSLCRC